MENRTYQTDDGLPAKDPLASLSPPAHWKPDTESAWKLLIERTESLATTSRLRLTVTGISLIAVGSILLIVPWHILRSPDQKRTEPVVVLSDVVPVLPERAEPVTVVKIQVTPEGEPHIAASTVPASEPARTPKSQERILLPDGQRTQSNDATHEAAKVESPRSAMGPPQQKLHEEPPPQSNVSEPVLLSTVQPQYTDEAREAKVQGTIELLVIVGVDGTAKVDSIRKGLGYGLDEKAQEAVEQWRFIPGKKDGKPVNVFTTVLVNFSLRTRQ